MKKINILSLLILVGASSQAKVSFSVRAGGGMIAGNAVEKQPIYKVSELIKAEEEQNKETRAQYRQPNVTQDKADSAPDKKERKFNEFFLANSERELTPEIKLNNTISDTMRQKIVNSGLRVGERLIFYFISKGIKHNNIENYVTSLIDEAFFETKEKSFVSPVGSVAFDVYIHNDKMFYGFSLGLNQPLLSKLSYDINEADLVFNSIVKEVAHYHVPNNRVSDILSTLSNPNQEKLVKILKKLDEKIDLNKTWNITTHAGMQFHAGPFMGLKINETVSASFMLAGAMKQASFTLNLKEEKKVEYVNGDLVFGIMPSLQLQFAINEQISLYAQAGYSYFFDGPTKKYEAPKTAIDFVKESLDTKGPKTIFNITGGVSYKIF